MANLSSKTGTITTPIQAQISLANNSTTSIQDFSAYEAQEITGFVYVDATTDLRCSFTVMVVKNGAGVWEVASTDLAGDNYSGSPLLVFSMSGSVLRVTLPNITPGFSSAFARYQLSAPYLGGNYPLSVSASQVLGNAAGTAPAAGYIGEVLENAPSDVTTNISTATTIGTITLTPGTWSVSATSYCRGAATQTGATHYFNALGVAGSTYSKDFMVASNSAGGTHAVTFNPRIVNVTSATATKTIIVQQTSTTAAGIGICYITAIRIA